jgi:AraC-like DNA-binding protein
MQNALSLRSYSRQAERHAHDFHQLMLPLQGVINIEVADFNGKVAPGEGIVIQQGEMHTFTALEQAIFIVADLTVLPEPLQQARRHFVINSALQHFLSFVQQQLLHSADAQITETMLALFCQLLHQQLYLQPSDKRIQAVQSFILDNLHQTMAVSYLAQIACLSPTQFKKLFSAQTGMAPASFITHQRMEKARALLINTDAPVQYVAEQVGYTDVTAFSRRFSQYFGLSPRQIRS